MIPILKPGLLPVILLFGGLAACLPGPTNPVPTAVVSPTLINPGVQEVESSSTPPVLKDSASMNIARVIPLGDDYFPFGLGFGRHSLWVLMRRTSFLPPGKILRVDPVSGLIAGEPIQFDFDPWSFAVTEEAVWVAKNGPQKVLRIDPVTQQVAASLDINAILVSADSKGAWISSGDFKDSTVLRIDPVTNQVVGDPIPVGMEPIQIVAGAGAVWVGAHSGPPAITRIDPMTGKAAATIEVGFPVHGLAAGPDSVWAVDYHEQKVVRISPQTNQIVGSPILIPFPPYAMAASATDAWVGAAAVGGEADPGEDRVLRIDLRTNTIVDAIHVGGPTIAMVFADGSLWIATQRPNLIVQVVPTSY